MRHPIIFTGSYLAMWIWLIVPFSLHVVIPIIDLSDQYLSIHLGGWMNEIGDAETFREAFWILGQDRVYERCEYLRFGSETMGAIILPAEDQSCPSLRFTGSSDGQLVGSVSYADLRARLLEELK